MLRRLRRFPWIGAAIGALLLVAYAASSWYLAYQVTLAERKLADMIQEEVKDRTGAPTWLVPALVPGMKAAARLFYGIDISSLKPIEAVSRLGYPVLLVHGTGDTRIHPSDSERMKGASPYGETELWLVPEAEHVQAYHTAPQDYIAQVASYFEKRLK